MTNIHTDFHICIVNAILSKNVVGLRMRRVGLGPLTFLGKRKAFMKNNRLKREERFEFYFNVFLPIHNTT